MENDNNSVPGSAWANLTASEDFFFWTRVIYPSGYTPLGLLITSLIVTFIMVIIVVGNVLVIIAIATEKSLKGIQNWFIASLAVADCLLGLIIMPFSLAKEMMGYWVFGQWWCDVHSAVDVLLCTSSIMNICLISLDRYWSITHAMEYLRQRTPSRVALMITIVWILSGLISIPPLLGWKKETPQGDFPLCELSTDIGYVLYSALGSFYIPSCIMVFVYIRIYFAARARTRRALENRMKRQSQNRKSTLAEVQATKQVIVCTDTEHHRATNGKSTSVLVNKDDVSVNKPSLRDDDKLAANAAPMALFKCKAPLTVHYCESEDVLVVNEPYSCNISAVSNCNQVLDDDDQQQQQQQQQQDGQSNQDGVPQSSPEKPDSDTETDLNLLRVEDCAKKTYSVSKWPKASIVIDSHEKRAYVLDKPTGEAAVISREEALAGRRTSLLCPTRKRFEKIARHLHQKRILSESTPAPTAAVQPDAEYSTSSYPSTPDNDPASSYPCPPLSPTADSDEDEALQKKETGFEAEVASEMEPSSSNSGTVSRCGVIRPLRIRFCRPIQTSAKSSKNRRQVIDTGRVGVRDKDPGRERRRLARQREKRATLILGLIMGAFILCWLPFFFLYLLNPMCPECNIQPWGFAIAFWLGYINSALNPVIYTIFNKDFRKAFRRILFRCTVARS